MRRREVIPDLATTVETILLVDDDARLLAPLQVLLEAEGYRILLALDGEAAASVTDLEHPDLIVTDWMMPVVDGVAFCRRLKTSRATARIPVVMLTAAVPPAPAEPLWNALLRKPAPVACLIEVIHDLLAVSRSRRPD
ncbi:response regulator [Paraburkholderia pallida]|uniref:response regulator n=1 Tax=Paraburkholderia pallida TaxID=2547399 RepID=UPI001E2EBD5C|nr:response regulator [Paraburkholderia pallida]